MQAVGLVPFGVPLSRLLLEDMKVPGLVISGFCYLTQVTA